MANELTGARELSKRLQKMGAAVGGKALRSAAMSSMLPVLKTAKARAPVSDRDEARLIPYGPRSSKKGEGRLVAPGFLSRNLARKSIISRDKRFVRVMVGVKPEAFYGAIWVELGTSKTAAQPFLEPALKSNKETVIKKLRERLSKIIDKAARIK